MSFQGARIEQETAAGIPASVVTAIPWGSPKIDTATFWDISAPTRLTIPASVNTIIAYAGARLVTVNSGSVQLSIRLNGSTNYAQINVNDNIAQALNLSTGPMSVNPGDYLEATLFLTYANSVYALSQSFFGLEVVGAA